MPRVVRATHVLCLCCERKQPVSQVLLQRTSLMSVSKRTPIKSSQGLCCFKTLVVPEIVSRQEKLLQRRALRIISDIQTCMPRAITSLYIYFGFLHISRLL